MSEEEKSIYKLPEGFKKVKYLIANGSQYIDTNYVPTNETGYYVECQSYQTDTNWRPVFGLFQRDITNSPRIYLYTNPYPCIGWITTAKALTSSTIYSKEKLKSEFNFLNSRKMTVSVNQNELTYDLSDLTFTPTKSLYLFSVNDSNSTTLTSGGSMCGRIDTFLISEGDQIVRQFVPCLDEDGIPCMYELYTGTAHYNQGSGQFSYPVDYPSSDYNLPAGYKKCVYLQSDGTQWIDTGVIPNNETGFYFKALQLSYGDFVPFGVGEGSNGIYPPRFKNKDLYYRWGGNTVKMMTWDKAGDLIFHSSLNLYNSKIAKFDSEDTDVESFITSQAGTYTIPIRIFSYNLNGSYSATYGKWIGRIYRAQITQGSDLIHDYVPCLDADNRPCMYDLIEQEALYNQSGGTEYDYCVEHQLPSDFIKLKYLEDNGTQWIETNIVPTNETGLYVDAQQITHTNSHSIGSGWDQAGTGFGVPRFLKGTANTCGFMWKYWKQYGSLGNGTRFEGTLNLYNNRKATLKTAGTTERINSLEELGFTPTASLHIFKSNYSTQQGWNGRIYRAKITQGTELIRDFVPAWDERKAKPCMYDLINNVAYYNDGTGEFLYNRDFEGTYKGFTGLGCIGNRLGSDYNPINEKLPSGYTRVEFLEGTGTQYIKTGVIANGNLTTKITVLSRKWDGWNNTNRVFGAEESETLRYYYSMNYNGGYGTRGLYRYGSQSEYFNDPHQLNVKYELVFNKNKVTRNGVEAKFVGGAKINEEEFAVANRDIWLFRINHKDDHPTSKVIYHFSIAENDLLKLNFIPAIDQNGKPCMFDTVSQKPFYNANTSTSAVDFIVGLKTLSHALQLRLPNDGGTITLSLPTNDNIEYYEEKIRNNNTNWTITFQYH